MKMVGRGIGALPSYTGLKITCSGAGEGAGAGKLLPMCVALARMVWRNALSRMC